MHDKHFCTRISGKDGKTWLQQSETLKIYLSANNQSQSTSLG